MKDASVDGWIDERRFRALLSATAQVVFRASPDWSELWEISAEGPAADGEAFAVWIERRIPAPDRGLVKGEVERARRERGTYDLEHRIRHPDGSLGWVRSRAVPLLGEDGEVREWVGTAEDTTARRQAEDSLRENEERLRLALQVAGLAAWDWNLGTGEVAWSAEHFRIHGYAPGEIEPSYEAWAARVHPEDLPSTEAAIEAARETGTDYVAEFRVLPGGGEVRWCRARAWFIYGRDRQAVRMIGVMQDVTEAHLAQRALERSEERLRRFGEASSSILWIGDAQGLGYEYLSPAFEPITGQTREEALAGDTLAAWLRMILPEDRDLAAGNLDAVLRGERRCFEYRIRRPSDGGLRWLSDTAFPIPDDDGRVRRIGGIVQDVTTLKNAEDRQRLLLAELQHRVRNSLAVIRSIVRRSAAGSRTVEDYATHLEGRINALARIQSAIARNPSLGLDLETILRDELRTAAAESQLRLDGPPVRLAPKVGETLALAFHELATNAIKHGALAAPGGGIEIAWSLEAAEPAPLLRVTWTERTPRPPRPRQRRGFGTELLERTLAYNLGARTSLDFGDAGLVCRIDLPLAGEDPLQPGPLSWRGL